jgi:hypothetical protein
MGDIFPILQKYFHQPKWRTAAIEQRTALRLQYFGESGRYTCVAQERAESGQLVFYIYFPKPVPPGRRKAITEFITRANFGLVVGNFELDLIDGELRYKANLDLEGEIPTMGLIHRVVSASTATVERYAPGIEKVLRRRQSPAEAIDEIDKG